MASDRAIEAAAEALRDSNMDDCWNRPLDVARIAVEAAAPYIRCAGPGAHLLWETEWKDLEERAERVERLLEEWKDGLNAWQERAERAEAEVEQLKRELGHTARIGYLLQAEKAAERILADELAEALQDIILAEFGSPVAGDKGWPWLPLQHSALARWEEARTEGEHSDGSERAGTMES